MKKIRLTRNIKLILLGLALIVGLVVVLEKMDRINLFSDNQTTPQPTGPSTKGEPKNSSDDTETRDNPQDTDKSQGPSENIPLKEPYGTFVSNHRPNLDGEPTPNVVQSTCVTTPGAKCIISFTKDGKTVTLPNRTTDKEGAAYWTWKLQDIGLTEGSWTINAKATLGSQTKTSQDDIPLEVRP